MKAEQKHYVEHPEYSNLAADSSDSGFRIDLLSASQLGKDGLCTGVCPRRNNRLA